MKNELYHHGVLGMKWGQRRSARNERNLKSKANQEKFGRREDIDRIRGREAVSKRIGKRK